VMATQNPLEMEGTYPLPEAQLDRFLLKIIVEYPERAELTEIVDRSMATEKPHVEAMVDREDILEVRRCAAEILVAPHVRDFAISLVLATQSGRPEAHPAANKYVRYGASPRGDTSVRPSAPTVPMIRNGLSSMIRRACFSSRSSSFSTARPFAAI